MATSVADLSRGDRAVLFMTALAAMLRDELFLDGYCEAAELMADLVDVGDDFLMHPPGR